MKQASIVTHIYQVSINSVLTASSGGKEGGDTQRSLRSLVSHLYMYVISVLTFNEFDNIGVRIQLMSRWKKRLCELIVLAESTEEDLLYEPIYLLRHASIASTS